MSLQHEIIKTALLGTNKVQFQLPEHLGIIRDGINSRQEDKEDAFLKSAAVAFLYEESGMEAPETASSIAVCPDETREELSPHISQYIEQAHLTKDEVLFEYLVHRSEQANKVAGPRLVPLLLSRATEQKKKTNNLLSLCGETGKWLCALNPEWKGLITEKEEQADWETGSFEERKALLVRLRRTEPGKALQLLQESFAQENANNRAEFIDLLHINLTLNDEAFLTAALRDKSKKVKEAALLLLRPLQGSSVNELFIAYFLDAVSVKEERSLLVLKKKVLSIDAAVLPSEELFNKGIEKVSSVKGVEDHLFWVAQIMAFIEPARLAAHFQLQEEDWLKLLLEHKHAAVFMPYLSNAALHFGDKLTAKKLLGYDEAFNAGLFRLLPEAERMEWYDKYLESRFPLILEMLLDAQYRILPPYLAERVIKRLVANPYQITQPVYQHLALSLPAGIKDFLRKYAEDNPEDYQKRYFSNQASNMLRYLELRENLNF